MNFSLCTLTIRWGSCIKTYHILSMQNPRYFQRFVHLSLLPQASMGSKFKVFWQWRVRSWKKKKKSLPKAALLPQSISPLTLQREEKRWMLRKPFHRYWMWHREGMVKSCSSNWEIFLFPSPTCRRSPSLGIPCVSTFTIHLCAFITYQPCKVYSSVFPKIFSQGCAVCLHLDHLHHLLKTPKPINTQSPTLLLPNPSNHQSALCP